MLTCWRLHLSLIRAPAQRSIQQRLPVMDFVLQPFISKHILTAFYIFSPNNQHTIQVTGIYLTWHTSTKKSSLHTELSSFWRHFINWIVLQPTLFMFFLMFWKSPLIEKHKEASKFHFYFLLHFRIMITTQLLLERGPAKKKQLVHCIFHFNTWAPYNTLETVTSPI